MKKRIFFTVRQIEGVSFISQFAMNLFLLLAFRGYFTNWSVRDETLLYR